MLGAIIGDIAGSRFEMNNRKSKDFNLFSAECFFTDDTVMTLAVAKTLLDCKGNYSNLSEKAISTMQEIGHLYPTCGYGRMFRRWLYSQQPKPYNSYGNGAAMRVSACGFAAKSLEEAKALSKAVTEVTHNHPEGIKGAEATAVAIYLARSGYSIEEIQQHISTKYYPMDFTLDEIRDTYEFNETCQDTVPQALKAFFESLDFEDAIRNAISIGGDSDTLAAITGGIAEAYYGVPQDIKDKALNYLDEDLLQIVNRFYSEFKKGETRWLNNIRVSGNNAQLVPFGLDKENVSVLDKELLFRVLWKRVNVQSLQVDGKDNRNRRIFVAQLGKNGLC